MDTKNNLNMQQLLINTFQELAEEEEQESIIKRESEYSPDSAIKQPLHKKPKFNDRAKRMQNESHNVNENGNTDNDQAEHTDDATVDLQDFVASILKFAPKQQMLVSDLALKITDTFDKSIKQMTGLKSRDFFAHICKNGVIEMHSQQTPNGSLSFARLCKHKKSSNIKNTAPSKTAPNTQSNKRRKNDNINNNNNRNTRQGSRSQPRNKNTSNQKSAASNITKQAPKKQLLPISSEEIGQLVRFALLRDFLSGKRERIMLSTVAEYAFRYFLIGWKKIMRQKPMEFVLEMVNDGLVHFDKKETNGSTYPFIMLNRENSYVQTLSVDYLDQQIADIQKKANVETKTNKNKQKKTKQQQHGNRGILRDLIVSKLKTDGVGKVFVSTIPGLVLNRFEKPWKMVMDCSVEQFVQSLVAQKLVNKKTMSGEEYLVIADGEDQDETVVKQASPKNERKRKLAVQESDEDTEEEEEVEIKKPKRKKQKVAEQRKQMKMEKKKKRVNMSENRKIDVPAIQISGMDAAQALIEKFSKLKEKHDVHFHFEIQH